MQLHSRRLGVAGGLPALMAHCFLGHGGSWKALLEALPVPLDALAPDLPGHGRSPMPAEPGDFHAAVSEALGALIERPSLLVGHSFGAASLLRYALHNTGQVTGLVLIEPVFFAVAEGQPEYAPYRASEAPLHAAVAEGRLDDAARHFLGLNPGSPDFDRLPPAIQAVMAAQMRLVAATGLGLFEDSGNLRAPGVMEGFAAPVLLLAGSGTTPIFHATIRELARKLPQAEAQVIDGAGHMVPITHPTQTAGIIGDWMQRVGLLEPSLT
ncbi:alpha/beta fold hydrolase [Pararhodobacter sp. CCB-MM2]|uniref:alpha/beta fold hydrolase n=1 Tax=Pararhodobacter sp. CCB-MM2 TaxID=1786003 RepID=UPI0008306C67|nr:alpha/beta hydrolase [Pararhodobacter sp. CCB-MM2]